MNVSDGILDLDAGDQAVFTNLLEESIASLLDTSSDNVDGVVSNFLDSRRLSMLTQESTVTLTRRLAGTDVSVSYTVRTTEDQVSSIIDGLTTTVATGLADHLTDAIATDGRLDETIFGVSDFSIPKVSLIGSSDAGVVTDMPITTSTVGLPVTTTTMTITTTMITTMIITTTSTTYTTTELATSIATTTAVIGTTTTITTILVTHEVSGTFKLTVSADTLDLDANGQATFISLLESSIAALLGISNAHVDAVVNNFNDNSRRLGMLARESVLALVRRLTTAELDISYTVSTTEDQVSSITQGLTNTVATDLTEHLSAAIAADDSLNVTVHGVSDFVTPTVTVVSTGDDTVTDDDDDDGLSVGIIVVIVLVCVLSLIILVVLFVLYRRRSSQPKNVNPGSNAEQPSQVEAVEA